MSEIVTEKSLIAFDATKKILTENKSSANTKHTPKAETYIRSVCRCIQPLTELMEVEGDYYCSDCYESETVTCSHCGTRIPLDDIAGADDFPLCQRCYDNYYIACSCCGRIIHGEGHKNRHSCYRETDIRKQKAA